MKTFIIMGTFLLSFLITGQQDSEKVDDYEKVKRAIITWADSTFKEYNEPRFEHFRANYTDDYLMASMRVKSIERSIKNLNKTYSSGYYNGTDEDYKTSLEDLEKRLEEAKINNENFQSKAENYQVAFWANIKMDSGILNYVKHAVILDNDFKVISHKITGSIGENENATIIYR